MSDLMKNEIKAKEVMVCDVITLSPQMTAREASRVFSVNQISGAPVVSEDGTLCGVLSQTDLVREAFEGELGNFPSNTYYIGALYFAENITDTVLEKLEDFLVEDAMSSDVVTVSPEDTVSHVARTLRSNKIHRVIVSDNGSVCGVITSFDLLALLEQQ
jgi:predicted transcriptional regulator